MGSGHGGDMVTWDEVDDLVAAAEAGQKARLADIWLIARLFATGWVLDFQGSQFLPPVVAGTRQRPSGPLAASEWRWRLPVERGGEAPQGTVRPVTLAQLETIGELVRAVPPS